MIFEFLIQVSEKEKALRSRPETSGAPGAVELDGIQDCLEPFIRLFLLEVTNLDLLYLQVPIKTYQKHWNHFQRFFKKRAILV